MTMLDGFSGIAEKTYRIDEFVSSHISAHSMVVIEKITD